MTVKQRCGGILAWTALCGVAAAAGVGPHGVPVSPVAKRMVASLEASFPGVGTYSMGDRVTTVFGPAFAFGQSPAQAADGFLREAAGAFGVAFEDLAPGSLAGDGLAERPLMPDDQGGMKFTLVSRLQRHQGIPVFRADVLVLVRNEAGSPVVLVKNQLKPLGDFALDAEAFAAVDFQKAFADAQLRFPGLTEFSVPDVVIWAGKDDEVTAPTLAVQFIAKNGEAGDPNYQKYLIVSDASTGRMLYSENQILHADITGQATGQSTQGYRADICDPEVPTPMPYIRVVANSVNYFADANGNFSVPGPGPTTLSSELRGRWFRVFNNGASVNPVSFSASDAAPADFQFNAANTDAAQRSGVNTYYQSNVVRDWVLLHAPSYPTIGTQTEFRININVSGTCNAFYDGSSINFYPAGGGCPATSFGDVVHHEYGHHLVNVAGSGQGQYGEGMGDTMGILITDQPRLALGFQSNCSTGIRNADNSRQYPCSEAIHTCGQLISGCFWDLRDELVAAGRSDYRTVTSRLAINSMPLHRGDLITPQITIDVMTLDDNDGNINNGTPNYTYIQRAFSAHNMPGPVLQPLSFSFPAGLPTELEAGRPTEIRFDVLDGSSRAQPGTGSLVYKVNGGLLQNASVQQIAPNQYLGTIPGVACGDSVLYSFSARTTEGNISFNPAGAPNSGYSALATSGVYDVVFTDDAQSNTGWTVSGNATDGQWTRGVPVNCNRGDPATDGDGTGAAWLTDNSAANSCNSDVDGGTTTATSPVIAASGTGGRVSYWRWFRNNIPANTTTDDRLIVDVSGNGGTTWQNLEIVGPTGDEVNGGWIRKTLALPASVTTANFRIRFSAEDINAASVVEAGFDGISVEVLDCTVVPCDADFNGDGFVDFFDFDDYVSCFEGVSCPNGQDADFNDDGFVDFFDLDDFVSTFEAGC